jgi:hypothetical protein
MTQSVVRLGFNKSCFPWVLWLFCFALDCDFTYGKVDFKEGQAIRAIGFQWRPFNLSRSFYDLPELPPWDNWFLRWLLLRTTYWLTGFLFRPSFAKCSDRFNGCRPVPTWCRHTRWGRVDPSTLRRWITGKAGRSWVRWTRAKFVMKHFRDASYLHMAFVTNSLHFYMNVPILGPG